VPLRSSLSQTLTALAAPRHCSCFLLSSRLTAFKSNSLAAIRTLHATTNFPQNRSLLIGNQIHIRRCAIRP
jgi:hypothetical protein